MVAPLAGIRVLEMANWNAVPSAAALLRDLGADVTKIEPPGGDPFRGLSFRLVGYDYVMIEGAAKEPVYLYVHDERVEIRPAKHVWGKLVAEGEDLIRGETHPDVKVASIGPAGEHRARTACVHGSSMEAIQYQN